ncbi:hypothetical protein, partial [Pseudomonas sp.]|uniref:hypothetical protein n=1 Tax=Pseudomonas sp. TaxID=306 RepID=UPI0028A266E2
RFISQNPYLREQVGVLSFPACYMQRPIPGLAKPPVGAGLPAKRPQLPPLNSSHHPSRLYPSNNEIGVKAMTHISAKRLLPQLESEH